MGKIFVNLHWKQNALKSLSLCLELKNTFYVQMTSYLGGCLAGTAGGGAEGVAA